MPSVISGSVIRYQNLEILVGLSQDRIESFAQVARPIESGNADGHCGPMAHEAVTVTDPRRAHKTRQIARPESATSKERDSPPPNPPFRAVGLPMCNSYPLSRESGQYQPSLSRPRNRR